jgi:O-antigen/teichoic acid export membrane protein
MEAKPFFKGLSWLLVLNLLIKPAWIFIIDRRVQNIVGHDVYGSYFALFNFTYVLLFLADAGLSNMLAQRLAAKEDSSVRQLLTVKLALLLLYAAACAGAGAATGISQWRLLGLLIAAQSLNSLFLFLRSLLQARQLFKTDALFSVLDKTLLLLLCIGPVYGLFFRMTITLFLQLQVLSTSLAVGCLFFSLLKKNAFTSGERLAAKTVIRRVTPFVLIVLLMSAHNRLDAFLLDRLHPNGAAQAGIYAMAYRLLDAANMLGYLTASFLVPFLARHQNDRKLVQQVLLVSRHGLLFASAIAVAFVVVFAPWLQSLLYHTTDAYSSRVIRLCIAVLPAYYLTHVYGSALTATAQFRAFIQVIFVSVLVNVLLNAWLIPLYGAAGCCMAALVSQYFCAFALWAIASRRLAVSPAGSSALLYPAIAILFAFSFYLGQMLTGHVWIILSSIAAVVFVLMIAQRNLLKKFLLLFYK